MRSIQLTASPENKTPLHRRLIGLTGGVGMGKTTVSHYLATTYHLPILDADIYARDAVKPGSEILLEIVERYGTGMLLSDRTLDRRRLSHIIFSSAAERLWLEQRIHPYVRDRFVQALQELGAFSTVVLVIPLLFEARMRDLVTEVWVVYCDLDQQIERMMQRDGVNVEGGDRLNREQIQARIDSQMTIDRKIASADVLLSNSTTPAALYEQVDMALQTPEDKALTKVDAQVWS